MEFDSNEHKELCKLMIEGASFPGKVIELAASFKQAVLIAEVKGEKKP